MKRDDIIRMAREAGFYFHDAGYAPILHTVAGEYSEACFERFAALVASAEREAWPNLECVASWIEGGCDPQEAAKELRLYIAAIRARGQA